MIEPLRFRDMNNETKYQQMRTVPRCFTCHQETHAIVPAVVLCADCKMKTYCLNCDMLEHSGAKKGYHKRKRIITGRPYKVDVLMDGDNLTFPKTFDWVTVNYRIFVKQAKDEVFSRKRDRLRQYLMHCFRTHYAQGKLIDSTVPVRFTLPWLLSLVGAGPRPLQFQVGCSGPCCHVQVHNCTNVAAMDSNGLSDPYVAVWYKDIMVGSTRVAPMTLNPEWKTESFVVPLDKQFNDCFKKKDTSTVITMKNKKSGHGHGPDAYRPGMPLTEDESSRIVSEITGDHAAFQLSKLRLDVFDYDRLSKNDFLGQKTFTDSDLLQIVLEADDKTIRSFPLTAKKARGVIGIKLSHVTTSTPQTLILQITDGKNLPKADPFNLSDPYCTVMFNGVKHGKTKTIKQTLDPVWNHAYFTFVLPAGRELESIRESQLVIEAWDWDRIGSDDQLGMLEFNGDEMVKLTEKSTETMLLGLDDEALTTVEQEFKRLEGTPKEKDFKVNVLHKIDMEAREERDRIKWENEEAERKNLQDKIDAGLETAEEAKMRKTMEKAQRNRARETHRAAKKELKKELKERGMKSMADRVGRETRATGSQQGSRDTGETTADKGDSLSAMLAEARAEVEEDIEKGIEGKDLFPEDGGGRERNSRGTSRQSRQSRKSSRGSRGSVGKGGRRGSLMCDLSPEQLTALAEDPELLLKQLKNGNVELGKEDMKSVKEGKQGNVEDGEAEGEDEEESEEESSEQSSDDENYEKGVCTQYNEFLGIRLVFEDFDGLHRVQREEWVKLANVPMVVKVGKNPELEAIWREQDAANQPIFKRLFYSRAKIAAEYDSKQEEQASWMDKMMGNNKNLGIKTYYPLFLPDSESGSADVQGNIGVRLLYHNRGTVLRGIDEVVSTMSLGEKCRIDVREDYAFGEAFGGFVLPPNSDLVVEVDLVDVRGAGFLYLLISRQLNFVMHKLWLVLQCFVWVFELNGRKECPLWCKTPWVTQRKSHEDHDEDEFDEEAMLDAGESKPSVELESSIESGDKAPGKSTLGARLMFAKF